MKLKILSKDCEVKGEIELPSQFNEKIRPDLIKRAFESEQNENRTPYGASKNAGMRHSVRISKRRHDYRGTYGIGQSRTPRKVMSRRGSRMNWTGAFAPMTVGGRRAHPPKSSKIWIRKINNKERNCAIRSAISATLSNDIAKVRGHKAPDNYPFAIDNSVCELKKTREVLDFFNKCGLGDDLKRARVKKIRPGLGKMRGRKYKKRKSALIVTTDKMNIEKSARNIPGIDIINIDQLNVNMLAPGSSPGRITFWSNSAIEKLSKDKMYM